MADVRLTATNPADSSVVPVACNEKGELKLEEIPDQSFDGNLQGDLTVSGSAEFAGRVTAESGVFVAADPSSSTGILSASSNSTSSGRNSSITYLGNGKISGYGIATDSDPKFTVDTTDGSAEFAGNVKCGPDRNNFTVAQQITNIPAVAVINGIAPNAYHDALYINYFASESSPPSKVISLKYDGSVTFAGNKAGFTAEGHLWCTTRRGDTVILDATSNGLASWVPYTPPRRLTELQDKWAEKDGILPVPHESSQDEPETTQ